MNIVSTVVFGDFAGIDKSEIDDVDRNFGIIRRLQLLPHRLLAEFGRRFRQYRLEAQRVGVSGFNAHERAITNGHGVAAAKALRNHHRGARVLTAT